MYPIMLNIRNLSIAIIGGGKIAYRKYKQLIKCGAKKILIVSPQLSDLFDNDVKLFTWAKNEYDKNYLKNKDIVFACTNSTELNKRISSDAKTLRILVNDTSYKRNSNFYNMATIQDDKKLIGVSTFGKNPALAKDIKNRIKRFLDENV